MRRTAVRFPALFKAHAAADAPGGHHWVTFLRAVGKKNLPLNVAVQVGRWGWVGGCCLKKYTLVMFLELPLSILSSSCVAFYTVSAGLQQP
jgi:hypothetical protein